jgi:hypothetical protein
MLFGWMPRDNRETAPVLAAMRAILRSTPNQHVSVWQEPGLGIGSIDLAPLDNEGAASRDPATAGDRYLLWMVGEAFEWPSQGGVGPGVARTTAFRQRLLDAILRRGPSAVRDLDGEYQIALWDRQTRELTVINDRFGALPLYWTEAADGFAFAGGVRGVLVAPGVSHEPDEEALRESVTFGGFRLGPRTNVRGVAMLAGASVLTSNGTAARTSRYWRWADIPAHGARPVAETIDELRQEWRRAITVRLESSGRPGLTLSGGLDSRAILAEGVRHAPLRAVTYGVAGSDDVRLARRAAEAAGARWTLHTLYSGDWLDRRTAFIQATDGLMDLVDLMHVEALDTLTTEVDLNLSGYIGDAVTGPTFNDVTSPEQVALALPYYGGTLGLPWEAAVERVRPLVRELGGAPARFALFEHKIPQSTNRITAALRPYVRVRRPFVDYQVFDLAQGQPAATRGAGALHDRWLRSTYPRCFARIAHQKTGVPPLTPRWRGRATRAVRYAWRAGLTGAAAIGMPVVPPRRSFQADDVHWRMPDARARIEESILRPDSLACGIFGSHAVQAVVRDWFDRLAAPTQVIGALYVFETYHRDLARTIREAHAVSAEALCSSSAQ